MQFMVHVIDDDNSVAEMMAPLLKRHGLRHQIFACVEDFVATRVSVVPSITFVSSGLPNDGMQRVLTELKLGRTASAIIMTCPNVAAVQIVQAMKAGAEDVLEKPFSEDQVLAIIKRVQSLPTIVVHAEHAMPARIAEKLTFEEQQILSLMEQGVAIKQIASKLDISVRTVHYRKASILEKTNCNTCTEVIAKMLAMRSHTSRPAIAPASAAFYTGGTFAGNDFQPVAD
jgi:FixJ family two-component response regulator